MQGAGEKMCLETSPVEVVQLAEKRWKPFGEEEKEQAEEEKVGEEEEQHQESWHWGKRMNLAWEESQSKGPHGRGQLHTFTYPQFCRASDVQQVLRPGEMKGLKLHLKAWKRERRGSSRGHETVKLPDPF